MKIIQKHEQCIGCGACTIVCPENWEMGEDNKARPKNGILNSEGNYQHESDNACNKEAADACPVQVIVLSDL